MKVFHIITHFDVGGAERVAINIAKSTSKDFEYHIFEVKKGEGAFSKQLIKECENANIKTHRSRISHPKLALLLFPLTFLCHIIRNRPNIIHTHTEIPDLAIYIWRKTLGVFFPTIKYVRTIHNTQLWNKWKWIGKKVESYDKLRTTIISISSSTQISYFEEYKKNTPIIYNGIEEVQQIPFKGIVLDRINILFAGRLEPQKGIETLVEVVKALQNDERFFFHIVGQGSMQYRIDELSNLKNVRLYPKIFQLSSYLNSFDYLFMPSLHEGLALMPIEAAFAKVPTIINRCPGLSDTLPVDWSLTVENNDGNKFLELFNNIEKVDRHKLGENAYNFALENFSIQKMQKEYETLYINL